jgi:Uma2 family endonuclease
MTPPPGNDHDSAVKYLVKALTLYLSSIDDKGGLYVPRAAIWTTQHTYLEPDLFYVSEETEKQFKSGRRTSADLVIEVISPGSAIYDRNTKADTYAALGVKELWLVDEQRSELEVRVLRGERFAEGQIFEGTDVVCSEVLPEFRLTVSDIFNG